MDRTPGSNRAVGRLKIGPVDAKARIEMTNAGLLAVGALVSGILLSTAVLVWAATAVPRARPGLSVLKR
jgi:hypothetical protein